MKNCIKVIGAREHNLKNISVEIPKNSLTVITGPSGSGKSSLALDILYVEGKRRYIESLSSYARQFLGLPKKPDFDSIEGLCPAIAIDQKTVGSNPRSTVGTITEIYDYMRVLFARIGTIMCPRCNVQIKAESTENIGSAIIKQFLGKTITIVAPIAHYKKGEFVSELEKLFNEGYYRFIIDGKKFIFRKQDEIKVLKLKKTERHSIDLLLDVCEVSYEELPRLQEAINSSYKLAHGVCKVILGEDSFVYSADRICIKCNYSFAEIEPRLFSFNSPIGACSECHGLGMLYKREKSLLQNDEGSNNVSEEQICFACNGKRLNKDALSIELNKKNIYQLGQLSIKDLLIFFQNLELDEEKLQMVDRLIQEILQRLHFLSDVGLEYLSLNRKASTLSGGEGQRIRLATQIGSSLSGVLYILDEPSIGLHQRDNHRLIKTLHKLRDLGNTVIVVEHDTDTMLNSDYIIDMGPAAGSHGGTVVSKGTPNEVTKDKYSLTGAYLSGRKLIEVPRDFRKPTSFLSLKNASMHNLKNIDVKFPLGVFCGISGVSGSGKSTLIIDELVPTLSKVLNKNKKNSAPWAKLIMQEKDKLSGYESLENLVVIDQKPIGRTPRSTPATYLGIFDEIRKLYAGLPESHVRGYKEGRFSFNTKDGRCSNCFGEGIVTIPMHFLADVVMTCSKCKGSRYNNQTLEIIFKGKNIAEILDMTALQALEFFQSYSRLAKRLKLLCDVGLDYLKLGQSSTTLSGGEAQRIKLASELAKRGNSTMYILDEPTTGLHNSDIAKLLSVLQSLVNKGNTVMVIEHNLDVLKTVDYLIDLGPEGGDGGGNIVASGTPDQVTKSKLSFTGSFLKQFFKN